MPTYNLASTTSSYKNLIDDLWTLIQEVQDESSAQIINDFIDISYNTSTTYAKTLTDGLFLVDSSLQQFAEDSTLAYETNLECFVIFQHKPSADFTSDFHKILALIEKKMKLSTGVGVYTKPLKNKFEILNIVRNSEIPDRFIPTSEGHPYYAANLTIRALKLGY